MRLGLRFVSLAFQRYHTVIQTRVIQEFSDASKRVVAVNHFLYSMRLSVSPVRVPTVLIGI